MGSKGLSISQAVMEKYTMGLDTNSNNLEKSNNDTNNNFTKLNDNGIYRDGFGKISKALTETIDTLKNCNRVNRAFMSSFQSLEEKGSSLVESIEVPRISNVSASLSLFKKDYLDISKNDGKEVNEDSLVDELELEDDYDEEEVELNNIEKEFNGDLSQAFNLTPDTKETNLEDIHKASDNQVLDLEDKFYAIENPELDNIGDKTSGAVIDFEDRHSFDEVEEFKNINNGSNTKELELVDDYNLDEVNLKKINNSIQFEPLNKE